MKYASPYTPEAGTMPPYLAGRTEVLEISNKNLESVLRGYPQKSVIYYGLRGGGKTVLLNVIEEKAEDMDILYEHIEISEKKSFIRQIANASKKIIHKMSTVEAAKDVIKKALGILQAFNVTYNPEGQTFSAGLSEPSAYVTTGILSEDLTEMFVFMGRSALKANKVICFFIDEIQYMREEEMEALINAVHRVNQKRLPIILFEAGLPKVLRILGEVKSYSERLFKFERIAELSEKEAREAVIKPAKDLGVVYHEDAVKEILKWSKGYPYLFRSFAILSGSIQKKISLNLEM